MFGVQNLNLCFVNPSRDLIKNLILIYGHRAREKSEELNGVNNLLEETKGLGLNLSSDSNDSNFSYEGGEDSDKEEKKKDKKEKKVNLLNT
jgi:viroplasmin and RNaseH domain-containing protein